MKENKLCLNPPLTNCFEYLLSKHIQIVVPQRRARAPIRIKCEERPDGLQNGGHKMARLCRRPLIDHCPELRGYKSDRKQTVTTASRQNLDNLPRDLMHERPQPGQRVLESICSRGPINCRLTLGEAAHTMCHDSLAFSLAIGRLRKHRADFLSPQLTHFRGQAIYVHDSASELAQERLVRRDGISARGL
jgi:hypothetical protein